MAHEITAHDNVLLHREAAWHGLGTIVQDAPTAVDALTIAGLNWNVDSYPMEITVAENRVPVHKYKVNVRSDTKQQLGLVGENYRIIQNAELAAFADALAEQDDKIKIETAGSIRGGERVWFLIKGESFSVRKEDEICPYILVSNGHDGYTAMRCTPTTIRVVCSNTLHAVIPDGQAQRRLTQANFVAHHTTTVMERVEEAKKALGLYGMALDATRECLDELAAKDVNNEMFKKFFVQCFVRDFGPIPVNPTTKAEENALERSMTAWHLVQKRFEDEKALAGTTMWNAFNAYTGYLQNDKPIRLKNEVLKMERKMEGQLFGDLATSARVSLELALAM